MRHIRAQYAGEVTLVDRWVGYFFERVRELGIWEDSLVVLLSDHGEPLGEHGIVRKVRPWPYEELSRIVLMVKPPEDAGSGPKRVRAFAQTVDVAPTILDLLGLGEGRSRWSVELAAEGRSLVPVIAGEEDSVRGWAVAGHYGRSWSIRTEEHSLYLWPGRAAPYTFGTRFIGEQERGEPELYEIDRGYVPPRPGDWEEGDQPERDNLAGERRELAEELELALRRCLMDIA